MTCSCLFCAVQGLPSSYQSCCKCSWTWSWSELKGSFCDYFPNQCLVWLCHGHLHLCRETDTSKVVWIALVELLDDLVAVLSCKSWRSIYSSHATSPSLFCLQTLFKEMYPPELFCPVGHCKCLRGDWVQIAAFCGQSECRAWLLCLPGFEWTSSLYTGCISVERSVCCV